MESEFSWSELRPMQSFEDKNHLDSAITKATEFAMFFVRHNNKTVILSRVPKSQESIFKKIELLETVPVYNPSFRFDHVAKLNLKTHYYTQFASEREYHQLYETLEQIDDTCILAVYAKNDPTIKIKILNWVTKKNPHGAKLSAVAQNMIEEAKKKAAEKHFFQCEIFLGANNKELFKILQNAVPKAVSNLVYFSQTKLGWNLKSCKTPFEFENHVSSKSYFASANYPLLSGPELHSIIGFPQKMDKFSISFGKQSAYTHGSQVPATVTNSLFDLTKPLEKTEQAEEPIETPELTDSEITNNT